MDLRGEIKREQLIEDEGWGKLGEENGRDTKGIGGKQIGK